MAQRELPGVGEEEPLVSRTSDEDKSSCCSWWCDYEERSWNDLCRSWWCDYKKWNCCLWLVIVTIVIFALLQITRFIMLVELLEDGSNTESNSTSIRTKLEYMLNVLGQSLTYCLEYITLIYGLCKFRCYYCKHKYDNTDASNGEINCIKVMVICITLQIVHVGVSLIPPILLIIWREDIVLGYKSNMHIANTYASLAIFDHFYNFLTRTGMVFVTVLVVRAWMKAAKNIEGYEELQDGMMISYLVRKYTETGEYVNALQTIFQSWFVIKWIIYFINIIGQSVLAAETIFKSENNDIKHEIIFILTHLVYSFLAFFFLFFCGSLMNLCHSKYRQRQQRKQEKLLLNATDVTPVVILRSSSTLIPLNPEYDFRPSVCMIDIPLNSPGYIVTIFLALFAFVANFLTQFQ